MKHLEPKKRSQSTYSQIILKQFCSAVCNIRLLSSLQSVMSRHNLCRQFKLYEFQVFFPYTDNKSV